MAAKAGAGAGSGGGGAVRTYEEELKFIEHVSPVEHRIKVGFVPGMRVEGTFYVNAALLDLQLEELQQYCKSEGVGGFLPAVKQIANVAALPGIVRVRWTSTRLYMLVRLPIAPTHTPLPTFRAAVNCTARRALWVRLLNWQRGRL